MKPLFFRKGKFTNKNFVREKGNDLSDPEISAQVEKVISDDMEIAETFNEFFVDIVPSLKVSPKENYEADVGNDDESILNYINKLKNHPSIKVIKSRKKEEQTFTFSYVSYEEVLNEIRKLQTTKTTQQNDIPTKILKENSEVFARYFHKNINFCIENSIFPSDLKVADVTPAFKKKSKTSKDNYRPISILPNISKTYERCLYNQMQTYFDNLLSKYQCGFRKGFNAQHCLVSMIEKWKESVDSGGAFGALMTYLSKAFDCLHHELLIAKLDAYGFDIKSVKLIQQYLSNRKQRVKVGNAYSSWKDIFYGIPQGSILGPLIFNIFLCDLFYFLEGVAVASYADDTTPYTANKTNDLVIKEIEHFSEVLFKWFDFNYMKINCEKSHMLFSGNDNVSANIDNHTIISENKNEALSLILDSKLSFEDHINDLFKKESQKLNGLATIAPYMCLEKRKPVMKAYVISQFGYCPLVWMFHSRGLNSKINSLHERALRITYEDRLLSFQ